MRDATPESSTISQQQLEDLLKHDEVTGLYSRRFFMETLEIDHEAVSYTHLDVYKRQALFRGHAAVSRTLHAQSGHSRLRPERHRAPSHPDDRAPARLDHPRAFDPADDRQAENAGLRAVSDLSLIHILAA